MNHFSFELSLLALLPGLFLCGYVFYKDRVEKEPFGLLALLFGMGAVAYIPSYLLQELVIKWIDKAFAGSMRFSAEGILTYSSSNTELLHHVLCAFFGFSLIQVCIKWAVLYLGTHKNKHFNYLFDGIVYSVFLSLGFAVAENLHFALQNDTDLLLAKLLTSIPCHLFIGILMGYYYTMWHMRFIANGIENEMLKEGLIREDKVRSSAGWLICSICIPVLVSSLYSLSASTTNRTLLLIFYSAVFILYGLSFIAINRIASQEDSSARYLCRVIAKGHPELAREEIERMVRSDLSDSKEVETE